MTTEPKKRGEVAPDRTPVNWRIFKRVLSALQADADRRGFRSKADLLNQMLTEHYFGGESLKNQGDR